MTRRRIANTDIKLIPRGYNGWEKGFFLKKIVFTLKKGICLIRALRDGYEFLFSGIN